MGLFGRGAKNAPEESVSVDPSAEGSFETSAEVGETGEVSGGDRTDLPERTQGPWDFEDSYPDLPRVDLGSVLVPQSEDFRIQVQADQATGAISVVSLVTDTSAVQVQAYAAPRSGGMWSDVRGQISGQVNKSGGLIEQATGSFGVELRAQVKGQDGALQPARFCGVDGPRWFVRLVFLGQAARDQTAAATLERAVREIVVIRGDQAMPMGNALPMRVPAEAMTGSPSPATPTQPQRPTISLPERGPEITETR